MTDKERLVELMKAVKYPVFPNSDNIADFGVQPLCSDGVCGG